MKLGLQAIDTSDSYYLNYDRRKLFNFIQNNGETIIKAESVLPDERVIDLTNAAKPDQLPSIAFASTAIEPDYFKAAGRIRDLIGTTAVNQAIQRLTDNPEIREWVQAGLEIHKTTTRNPASSAALRSPSFVPRRLLPTSARSSRSFRADFRTRRHGLNLKALQLISFPHRPSFIKNYRPRQRSFKRTTQLLLKRSTSKSTPGGKP